MGSIWQNAPAWWLEEGNYDGITRVSELRAHGDLGIGAFDQLDGELVGVDGVFYQVADDFLAIPAPDDAAVPFCMVTRFDPDDRFAVPAGLTGDSLGPFLDERLASGSFYSLRLDGVFETLVTRYLPRQTRPFPKLAEVAGSEPERSYDRVEGTMVGFRAPGYAGRIAPPGDHLHFLSLDRSFGGHTLAFSVASAEVAVERIETQTIAYPQGRAVAAR